MILKDQHNAAALTQREASYLFHLPHETIKVVIWKQHHSASSMRRLLRCKFDCTRPVQHADDLQRIPLQHRHRVCILHRRQDRLERRTPYHNELMDIDFCLEQSFEQCLRGRKERSALDQIER
jgi:hypothetical protein